MRKIKITFKNTDQYIIYLDANMNEIIRKYSFVRVTDENKYWLEIPISELDLNKEYVFYLTDRSNNKIFCHDLDIFQYDVNSVWDKLINFHKKYKIIKKIREKIYGC